MGGKIGSAEWGLTACKGAQTLNLHARDRPDARFGRSERPDCLIWMLWTSRLLNLDALDVEIVQFGRSGRPDC